MRTVGRVDLTWGAKIRSGVTMASNRLTLGHGTTVNYGCVFDNRAPVRIGDHVGVGVGVRFITSSHAFDDPTLRAGLESLGPITVGDGAWIGSGATLLMGVSVGAGAVIAAGAVVRTDCEAHCLYGGVPARMIRALER